MAACLAPSLIFLCSRQRKKRKLSKTVKQRPAPSTINLASTERWVLGLARADFFRLEPSSSQELLARVEFELARHANFGSKMLSHFSTKIKRLSNPLICRNMHFLKKITLLQFWTFLWFLSKFWKKSLKTERSSQLAPAWLVRAGLGSARARAFSSRAKLDSSPTF